MKKIEPFLICFIGIDGSGKTTQAKALVQALDARGVKSRYVWNRSEPFLVKPFVTIAKALISPGKNMIQNEREYSKTKMRLFQNPILSMAYQYLVLLDYIIMTIIRIKIPLMLGKSIISDRYIHDMIVILAADLSSSPKSTNKMLKGSISLLPKPDLIFLLDVAEEMGFRRKSDIKYAIDDLRKRRKIYLEIGKEYGITVLNSSKRNFDEVKKIILNKVMAFVENILGKSFAR